MTPEPIGSVRNMLQVPTWSWGILALVVLVSVAIDLFGHRGQRSQGRKAAVRWSIAWVALAIAFGGFVAARFGASAAQDYYAAYLIEKSLSVDNLFVFLVVFARLKIPRDEQHRVLQWGIFGAFLTRGLFIAGGSALLASWHGLVYVLGAFLVYTGIKTARHHGGTEGEGKVLAFTIRHLPFSSRIEGHRFFTKENGKWLATPLFVALVVIEVTDVLFALDSIPAVFAISSDPFIVYSSNVFAILGLRALYLVLADLLEDLKFLHLGLGAILIFAGAKMLASDFVHVPHVVSLATIIGILVAAIVPSVISRRRAKRAREERGQEEGQHGQNGQDVQDGQDGHGQHGHRHGHSGEEPSA